MLDSYFTSVYDCDFDQRLGVTLDSGRPAGKIRLRDLGAVRLEGVSIAVADHCYGCTAVQGSSCGGALGA